MKLFKIFNIYFFILKLLCFSCVAMAHANKKNERLAMTNPLVSPTSANQTNKNLLEMNMRQLILGKFQFVNYSKN